MAVWGRHCASRIDAVCQGHHRLVPDRRHERKRNRALAHGEIGREHAALGDDRGSVSRARPAARKRPQGGPVEVVDEPVAVRPEQGKIARRLDQCRLERRALRAGLREPRGVADRPASAYCGQSRHGADGRLARHRHECGVGRLRKVFDVAEAPVSADRPSARIDGPYRPPVSDSRALPRHRPGLAPADDGHVAGLQQTLEVEAPSRIHAGAGLSHRAGPLHRVAFMLRAA